MSDRLDRAASPPAGRRRARWNAARQRFWPLIAGMVAGLWPPLANGADPLPSFNVDRDQTSVSGLSSGAYMAGQFHLAYSNTLVGAGVVAGGPYDCARGQLSLALDQCMQTRLGLPDPDALLARARDRAAQRAIDPLAGLQADRVYVFSGTRDQTVSSSVVDQTVAFYQAAGLPAEAIRYVNDLPAGHAFITEDEGAACDTTASPFINDCDYDQAGDLLGHIYGDLNPPAAAPTGRFIAFDQRAFLNDPIRHGLGETGFLYVPPDCAAGAACRIHVVFHGCRQTFGMIGDRFQKGSGYHRWAETNRLIILYPEAHATLANPQGCWDWWGYDDHAYATQNGRQMEAVRAMIDRLAGAPSPPCATHKSANWVHWQEQRAFLCALWSFCAFGSKAPLGTAWSTTTLYEQPRGYFQLDACAS